MDRFKFDSAHSKTIVNAIVEGYRDYIEHRKDRYEKMNISSAFAWTKGNFIESKLAEISDDLPISYKKAKAGLTWDYLQFIQDNKKSLFLMLFCPTRIPITNIVERIFMNFPKLIAD